MQRCYAVDGSVSGGFHVGLGEFRLEFAFRDGIGGAVAVSDHVDGPFTHLPSEG